MGVACRRRPRGRRGRLHGGHRRSDRARGCNRAAHRCGRERQHPLCPDLDHSPRLIRAEAEGARAVSRSAPRPSIHHDPPDTPIDLLRRGADGPPRRLFPGSVRPAAYSTEHMFQSSVKSLRAWFSLADELLGGTPPAEAHLESPSWATHPHRRPLSRQRKRRGGSVPAAPARCLCPVRATRVQGQSGSERLAADESTSS